jgi:hypothetical protein
MIRAFRNICKRFGSENADHLALGDLDCDIATLTCPACGAPFAMKRHGYYHRHLVWMDGCDIRDDLIRIVRVRCTSCKTTHALLPLSVIPYVVYSITFIAQLMSDWMNRAFPSLVALCAHYRITSNTFGRLRERFVVATSLALGLSAEVSARQAFASRLARDTAMVLDGILSEFFKRCGMSFCQSRSP